MGKFAPVTKYAIAAILLLLTEHGQATWSVGAKNFHQIFESLSLLTQVPLADPDIQLLMSTHRERLPRSGSIDEISIPTLYSVIPVADMFCSKWISAESLRAPEQRRGHRMIDFSQGSAALTESAKAELIEVHGQVFWQRTPGQEERLILLEALNQTISLLPNDVASVPMILRPICISMITSLSFLTN